MKNNFLKLLSTIFVSLSIVSCSNKQNIDVEFIEEIDNDQISYEITDGNNYFDVFENDNYQISFKEKTDVFKIKDKRNNYVWKTGIDVEINTSFCSVLERAERRNCMIANPVVEDGLEAVYLALANSFITLETYQIAGGNNSAYYIGSCYEGVSSKLYKVRNENNHYKFVIDYSNTKDDPLDILVKVDIYFTDLGYDVKILDQNIIGKDTYKIKNILISPFLGSSGGRLGVYNSETRTYDIQDKDFENGYIFVPDGSGAIINQTNNDVKDLSAYSSKVYGQDPSHYTSYSSSGSPVMTIKPAKMPVFGIVKPDSNAAFVAYSKRGNEYMSINVKPDNSSNTQYCWAYPAYEYNFEYFQIYNKAGAGYVKIADDRNHFALQMQYNFLANEEASYIGMAKSYKDYLLNNGTLKQLESDNSNNIAARFDFLMSDNEDALVGSGRVISTTAPQLEKILYDIKNNLKVDEAVISMYGWQSLGKTLQHPGKANLSSSIGSASQYNNLIKDMKKINYEVAFNENYYLLNNKKMAFLNNAAKHYNGYYNKFYDWDLEFINEFSNARADRSYDFVVSQHKALSNKVDYDNFTVEGISSNLSSSSTNITRYNASKYLQEALKYLKDNNITINAIAPNDYLWKYVDRYFDADAYDSALLIENETVPFLQYVLNNTMEVYSPYCNFSFYDDRSICRMIDFNMYPSFMLTNDSAYYLLSTNSNLYFSTQYSEYTNLIKNIYQNVNSALSKVKNALWINREVNNNVVTNSYDNGKKIIINYNNQDVNVDGKVIKALGFEVI